MLAYVTAVAGVVLSLLGAPPAHAHDATVAASEDWYTAGPDRVTTAPGRSVEVDLFANDVSRCWSGSVLLRRLFNDGPAVAVEPLGQLVPELGWRSGRVRVTPSAGFTGERVVTYVVMCPGGSFSGGLGPVAEGTLRVEAVAAAPTAPATRPSAHAVPRSPTSAQPTGVPSALPFTGAPARTVAATGVTGAALVVTGAALVVAGRRRRRSSAR